jgi:hypothetical protein
MFSGGQSSAGGAADVQNVEEVVLIKTPQAGQYQVTVRAAQVAIGQQKFALVTTGAFANWP